jgi:predicted methyltransferase
MRPAAVKNAATSALAAWLVACGAPLPSGNGAHQAGEAGRRKPAQVMSFTGASWLEREGREVEDKPELVIAAMELAPGLTAADLGAGTGFFTRRIARAVSPGGKVYAVDIQPEMLELLKKYSAEEGLDNIEPVLGTETDPKLPVGVIDRLLMVDVYHEFQQPEPMLARIRASLAPGGTVTLVEYRAEGTTAAHIKPEHRMSVEQVLEEWTAAGFLLVDRSEVLPAQHLFTFRARRGARER